MKITNWKKAGLALLLILSVLFLYLFQEMLFRNPFSEINFENIVYVTKDAENNRILIDLSKERVMKIDEENVLQWEMNASREKFTEVERAAVDDRGHIYLLDIVKEDGGFRIEKEQILEYSPSGEFLGTIVEYNYEKGILWSRIGGLFPEEEGVSYAYKQNHAVEIYRDHRIVESCEIDQAWRCVASIAWDSEREEVYYSNFQGQICRYIEGKADEILYDAADAKELSIPREISLDPENNLYVTDIGLRDVLKISGGEVERIDEALDYDEKEIAYYLNADHGLIVCTNYSVKLYDDGEYAYITSCSMSKGQVMLCVLSWIAVAVLILIALYLILLFSRYAFNIPSKFVKMSIGLVLGISCLTALIVGILFPRFQMRLLDEVFSRAQMASEIMAVNLPYEAFTRLDSADDFMGEDYRAVEEAVSRVFLEEEDANIYDFYCSLFSIQNGVITSTYTLDNPGIYPYDWEYEGSDEQEIIETREGKTYQRLTSEGSYLFVLNPLIDDKGKVIGLIEVGTDMNSFQRENQKILLDLLINALAITVVVILMMIEVLLFFYAKSDYDKKLQIDPDVWRRMPVPADVLRMIVFMVFLLTNVATAFLPIYGLHLADEAGLGFIPNEVLAALPISAEVVTGAVFSIFGSSVIERLGNRRAAAFSAILFILGFVFRIVPNIWMLILGNAVIGVGWGVLLLMVDVQVAMLPEEEKNKGYASHSVAVTNGVNCGVVFGGFLINWFSYQWIMILTAVLSLSIYFVVRKYLTCCEAEVTEEGFDGEKGHMGILPFLLKGKILTYFVMIVIPVVACGYFLNYTFPLLASDYGLEETYIGYSYLLNGLSVMCFSRVLTDFMSRRIKKAPSLALASVIYGLAFLIVAWYQNLPALLVAIVLLGVSDSFGLPIQTSYYTDLEEVKEFGYDRAIGVYNLFENAAQAAGPLAFSYILLIGVREGLYLIVGTLLVLAAAFLVCSKLMGKKSAS